MEDDDNTRSDIEKALVGPEGNRDGTARRELEGDPLGLAGAHEYDTHERIISCYRRALSDLSTLLQEQVSYLSLLYRIGESTKGKTDLGEICLHVIDGALQDLRSEYCGFVFFEDPDAPAQPLCIEGIQEDRRFLRVHTELKLLGSAELYRLGVQQFSGTASTLHIRDVYGDTRTQNLDLPSVARSLVFLPLAAGAANVGIMVVAHSLPFYFQQNDVRIMTILARAVEHFAVFAGARNSVGGGEVPVQARLPWNREEGDEFSVIVLHLDSVDSAGKSVPPSWTSMKEVRVLLGGVLEGREAILPHGFQEILVVLPEVSREALPARVIRLRECFCSWRKQQQEPERSIRLSLGYASCEGGLDLAQTLEVAGHLMHPESDDGLWATA